MLNQTSSVMDGYHGDKENLIRTFYLVIQVSHLLMAGQVRITFRANLHVPYSQNFSRRKFLPVSQPAFGEKFIHEFLSCVNDYIKDMATFLD